MSSILYVYSQINANGQFVIGVHVIITIKTELLGQL